MIFELERHVEAARRYNYDAATPPNTLTVKLLKEPYYWIPEIAEGDNPLSEIWAKVLNETFSEKYSEIDWDMWHGNGVIAEAEATLHEYTLLNIERMQSCANLALERYNLIYDRLYGFISEEQTTSHTQTALPKNRYKIESYWWGLETLYTVYYFGNYSELERVGLFKKQRVNLKGWHAIASGIETRYDAERIIEQEIRARA